ncbi:Leucine-rich repeat-containing protein 34 [Apophysomyces ossiformis]|uniref:Leucine-rich repeat-containing protein 34 n=1 Tax=Apophysomyces ossiformis TaxID=679940 RepID=A0A8H7BXQ3_9FUNG|nr:Leucine-rich repeat-containing protein 34 [Apophysomyces ossiformis]
MAWGGNDKGVEKWIKQLNENDPKLKTLHILSFRRVSPADLKAIFVAVAHNTTLKELYCSGHALDLAAAEQLSEALTLNDTLESLNIGNNELGKNDDIVAILCEGLAVNEGLLTLDWENKGLNNSSVQALAKCLKKNTVLKNLNLSRNELDDDAIQTLVLALQENETLHSLNLSMNAIGPAGAERLASYIAGNCHLIELDVSDNALMEGGETLGASLSNNKSIETLKMTGVTSKLEDLQLPSAAGADSQATDVKADESQSAHGNAIAKAVAKALSGNRSLKHLWLDHNHIQSISLVTLASMLPQSELIELRLRNNRLDNEGAKALAQSPGKLRHVELGENAIGSEGLGALLDTSLEYVGLFNNQVGGFGAEPERIPDLSNSKVQTLDIGCNGVTLEDVNAMIELLLAGGVPDLKLLEMGGNAEDKEMDGWEKSIERLQREKPEIEVAWKRLKSGEMAQ